MVKNLLANFFESTFMKFKSTLPKLASREDEFVRMDYRAANAFQIEKNKRKWKINILKFFP